MPGSVTIPWAYYGLVLQLTKFYLKPNQHLHGHDYLCNSVNQYCMFYSSYFSGTNYHLTDMTGLLIVVERRFVMLLITMTLGSLPNTPFWTCGLLWTPSEQYGIAWGLPGFVGPPRDTPDLKRVLVTANSSHSFCNRKPKTHCTWKWTSALSTSQPLNNNNNQQWGHYSWPCFGPRVEICVCFFFEKTE